MGILWTQTSKDVENSLIWGIHSLFSTQLKSLLQNHPTLGFPGGSDSKESACSAGDLGSIAGLGRSPGEGYGNPLQYSRPENFMDRGAWCATTEWVTLVTKLWEDLSQGLATCLAHSKHERKFLPLPRPWCHLCITCYHRPNKSLIMLFSTPVEGFSGGSDGKECTSNAGDQALFFFQIMLITNLFHSCSHISH